jgi:TetR/AcrR family transcriptional repressor of nem operon
MIRRAMKPHRGKWERTHQQIVALAAELFRAHGSTAVGVDELMGAAGRTRGGFYAHFENKSALLEEAIDAAFNQTISRYLANPHGGEKFVSTAAERYLGSEHLLNPSTGCAGPTLATEISRASPRVRRAFTRNIVRVLEGFLVKRGKRGPSARPEAIATLCLWAGSMLIARGVNDAKLQAEILEAGRKVHVTSGARPASDRSGAKARHTPRHRPSRRARRGRDSR